jgi:hypothetical protein
MLLTLFAYLIYRDVRTISEQPLDPYGGPPARDTLQAAILMIFLWPLVLIPVGQKLESPRHQHIWTLFWACAGILSLAFGAVYLIIGITLAMIKGTAYTYYYFKYAQES